MTLRTSSFSCRTQRTRANPIGIWDRMSVAKRAEVMNFCSNKYSNLFPRNEKNREERLGEFWTHLARNHRALRSQKLDHESPNRIRRSLLLSNCNSQQYRLG